MPPNFISETEMPGRKLTAETLQIICFRYHFASQFVQGKQVLEVGCGPGIGLGYLARRADRLIGGDCTEESLRCAQQHYRGTAELLLLDARELPFKDGRFDVVVAMAVTYCLNMDEFLNECHRILRREGNLVFCMPNKDQPGFRPSPLSKNYFSAPELLALLSRHHFDAKLFAAFPARTPQKLHVASKGIVRSIGRILDLMPKGKEVKGFLKNRIVGRSKTLILKEEIGEDIDNGIIEGVQLRPISDDFPSFRYRMLYGIAYRR